jgi:hypothetical protein
VAALIIGIESSSTVSVYDELVLELSSLLQMMFSRTFGPFVEGT